MIVAIALWIAMHFGGGAATPFGESTHLVKERIEAAIKDDTRRDAALAVIDRVLDHEAQLNDALSDDLQHCMTIASDHEKDAAAVQSKVQVITTAVGATRDHLLDLRFELRDQMTADEWAQVFPPQ